LSDVCTGKLTAVARQYTFYQDYKESRPTFHKWNITTNMILSYRQLYVITKQQHVTKTEPFLSEMTHAM